MENDRSSARVRFESSSLPAQIVAKWRHVPEKTRSGGCYKMIPRYLQISLELTIKLAIFNHQNSVVDERCEAPHVAHSFINLDSLSGIDLDSRLLSRHTA
jgi:hypothetical protein